ncbi:MAG: RNA 2',3'-cyclic phosphodiesterase, partial [Bacteriovoracia bacterium]
MRLFIGLEVPLHLKNHIHKFLLPMQVTGKGWENPHDYHQTLLFIGETPENEVNKIIERLDALEFHPFELKLSQFQFFNRRIMYLALHPSGDLIELKKTINDAFPEWGQEETKEFIPHITVKRWQRYE